MDMRRRFLLVIGVVLVTVVGGMSAADGLVQYVRLSGASRYDTAVALANQFVTAPTPTVYVASGAAFPDALAASAAAAHVGAPVLLTLPGSLPTGTHDELVALNPSKVVLVGGPSAVSAAVKTAIQTALPNATISRVGADIGTRYDTAAALSQSAFGTNVPVAYVASGETFPDALSGSAAAGTLGGPVLLVQPSGPESQSFVDELQRLHPAKVVLLGGFSAIAQTQEAFIQAQVGTRPVDRVFGPDRYATSVAVSVDAFDPGVPYLFLTTGENYPDGLAAGAIAGAAHVPVLLTHKTCVPQAVADEITRLGPGQVYVLGGTGAVSYSLDSPPPIC
jgi:putative cell wall-binding protein